MQKYIDELFDNKVDLNEYESFKRLMFDEHHKMKDDIEEYILRDPEAAGIVHYVKYNILNDSSFNRVILNDCRHYVPIIYIFVTELLKNKIRWKSLEKPNQPTSL